LLDVEREGRALAENMVTGAGGYSCGRCKKRCWGLAHQSVHPAIDMKLTALSKFCDCETSYDDELMNGRRALALKLRRSSVSCSIGAVDGGVFRVSAHWLPISAARA
jgi:hypothetical protein